MKHLVLHIKNGWVSYQMGDQSGTHPIGDDPPSQAIAYLIHIIQPSSHEVHYPEKQLSNKFDDKP